jgi:type II secretory ATPase GspE/PulE/Tfp pilus assembly ATPase PilB-like protein
VSRIKIMSDLDIAEHRHAQDGKINFQKFAPVKLELRVATIPTSQGLEDVVLRLLGSAKPLPIDRLGLSPANLAMLTKMSERSYGLILMCGPTGSGKTTTLHSVLSHINTPDRKIWTAEDPIEITQEGLRQVQVNSKIGWTFAAAMRSFLRADPDVIMVGEMRDDETCKIGIEASLTGHLVFSTLHTNSAPESVVRLLDLGMEPFNFADALVGVLSQRLTRCLCTDCKDAHAATDAELAALTEEYCRGTALKPVETIQRWQERFGRNGEIWIYQARGCTKCSGTGYRGRLGIHELLPATPRIKQLVQRKATVAELFEAGYEAGMVNLRQDGIEKMLQGLTDLREVRTSCS